MVKNFRIWLFESEFERSDWGDTHRFRHHAEVRGHSITTTFHNEDRSGPGHYAVEFDVNGSMFGTGSNQPKAMEAHHVLHHVAAVVHKFKTEMKPKELHFMALEPHKNTAYRTFGKMIARKYGGEHSSTGDERFYEKHTVRFHK